MAPKKDKAAAKAAVKPAAAAKPPKVDPDSIPASAAEMADARSGETTPSPTRPGSKTATAALVAAPAEDLVSASNPAFAAVFPITNENRKRKGFKVVEVVATRGGYYGDKRRKPGEVFEMGIVGPGYLPTWVKLAKGEDKDEEVSRSRQVSRNSTGQEIIDDVTRDAGTEVPTYLGGGQRRPDDFRP